MPYTIALLILLFLHILTILKIIQVRKGMRSLDKDVPNDPKDLPLLSVIVPMRNEESNAEGAIRGLLAQDHPNFEIVVVNDGSTDRTGEILVGLAAQDERLRVVAGQDLPDGWRGKNFALWQGYQNARGEHFLLLDADVRLEPEALSRSVRAMLSREADMFTLLPRLVTGSFWEHVVQTSLFQVFVSWLPIDDIENLKKSFSLANGPYILITRRAYEKLGGHEALKSEIAEDFILARRLKEEGFRPTYWDGHKYASLRMYETFRGLWEGWTKNFYFGLGESLVLASFFILAIMAYFIFPYLAFLLFGGFGIASFCGMSVPPETWYALGFATLIILCQSVVRHLFHLFYGVSPKHQWAELIGFLVIISLIKNSFYRYLFVGEVTWRGRSHKTTK